MKSLNQRTELEEGLRRPQKKDSTLYRLSPELYEHGLFRMRGRLDKCSLSDEALRRPIIFPRRHHVTGLILHAYHVKYRHCNHRTVINEVHARYYIPRVLAEYNRVRNSCQHCKNSKATPDPPMMGSIPKCRTAVAQRAFTYTGLDYFGPMYVVVGRRSEKRWGVIITCLTTRAIHLEVAHSLNTFSCILTIRRFVARRGSPREIINDRGTNFVGASREPKEDMSKVNVDELMLLFSSSSFRWTFNPPAAPHFGGCWERLVRSVKRVLNEFNLPRLPSDEVLQSTLAEVEMIVNSRPLTYVPLNEEMDRPITPNYLLLGSSDGTKPLVPFEDSPAAVSSMWMTAQRNADAFWKRWVADYLRRSKWFQPVRPIKEGDVVRIVDANLPRHSWPKGRMLTEIN
ncbi:uncharacterized protein LOC120904591 [Anopheles arabiensis]|uniref:uncharacterized protein LOC120904591 n=1 Tax=Anopheles arabiensis TaxID=7173 RepID=UPI001AADB31A|nr:uncharacterized protein LOC120904591 [Anopheles arabiensis]XP_040170619.1 uncharacterized protein LOC120904591 [Anopheles arabiensis]